MLDKNNGYRQPTQAHAFQEGRRSSNTCCYIQCAIAFFVPNSRIHNKTVVVYNNKSNNSTGSSYDEIAVVEAWRKDIARTVLVAALAAAAAWPGHERYVCLVQKKEFHEREKLVKLKLAYQHLHAIAMRQWEHPNDDHDKML
jgi:hypothetical protein